MTWEGKFNLSKDRKVGEIAIEVGNSIHFAPSDGHRTLEFTNPPGNMGASGSLTLPQKPPGRADDRGPKPLTAKQLRAYPDSARNFSLPDPTSKATVPVGASRGRSFGLHYQIYGSGPVRILWLYGNGDQITSWHRYIEHFCIPNGDRYTSLFIQTRGVKESEGPFGLWTMKNLASDALDLLDSLKWTEDRSIHVVGHSMGGMQAQELALLCPSRIASLSLLATTSNWMADLSLLNCTKGILSNFLPKSEDQKIAQAKEYFFGNAWLGEPDQEGIFPTNGDNWAARDYLNMDIPYRGAILQMPACLGHRVSPEDLKTLVHQVGGLRVQVMHGRSDNIVPLTAGQKLYDALGGDGSGVQFHAFEDTGHIITTERFPEVIKLLDAMIASTMSSNKE